MDTKNLAIQVLILFSSLLLVQGCGPSEPEPINTDLKLEVKTRTFGSGVSYIINTVENINEDGSIIISDLLVEDAAKACLCKYQKINCNGISSKVRIINPNKSLANYIFINDSYKGKTKSQENISQAILTKMEEAGVISINERILDVTRFYVEAVDEAKLKKHFKEKDKRFANQTKCMANQTQRNNNPSSATLKHLATTKEFLGSLSFCLGVDIFLTDAIKKNKIFKEHVLFDIETTDNPVTLATQLAKYGLTVKQHKVKSKVLEVNVTPQMINLTKKGINE